MINVNRTINKGNIDKLINIEIASLSVALEQQKTLSKQILLFLKNFIGNIEVDSIFSNEINQFISNSSSNLITINSNINVYTNLLEILDNINFNLSSLDFKDIISRINLYNKKNEVVTKLVLKNTSSIQSFIQSMNSIDVSEYISLNNIDNVINTTSLAKENTETVNKITHTYIRRKSSTALIENTLTISETNGLVTLPYTIVDLQKAIRNNPERYSSLSDVVLSLYTRPLKEYKYSAISRFREAYNLMINIEKSTKKEALKLAIELFSNYNLHPAIITACKNLNELDIYLSCLEYNELEDFHFFKIVYEALPVISKKNKEILDV